MTAPQSTLFQDLPPFERLRAVPADCPTLGWHPEGYRLAFVARGSNVGFQVPDEVTICYGNPQRGDGGPYTALHAFITRRLDALLAATHLNRNAFTPRLTVLNVAGFATQVEYYDGEFRRDAAGSYQAASGNRFRWSRANRHSIVLVANGIKIAIRGCRLAGVEEFHLYTMAESLAFPKADRGGTA